MGLSLESSGVDPIPSATDFLGYQGTYILKDDPEINMN
jgi:hypothetical protein